MTEWLCIHLQVIFVYDNGPLGVSLEPRAQHWETQESPLVSQDRSTDSVLILWATLLQCDISRVTPGMKLCCLACLYCALELVQRSWDSVGYDGPAP